MAEQIPVHYVRGTHYQVGFSVGRTFQSLIKGFLQDYPDFNRVLIPAYGTTEGREIYEDTLEICKTRYPQYVEEIRGIAEGAEIPFYQLFLLHIEPSMELKNIEKGPGMGCTAILSNCDEILLGHTEDSPPELLNRIFIVSAQVVDDAGVIIEDFASLTVPGGLPGCTMGFNRFGLIYSCNAIVPVDTYGGRTPTTFLGRALLNARSMEQALEILKDTGVGIADSCTWNVIFSNEGVNPLVANIEMGSNRSSVKESEMNVLFLAKGSTYVHCNRYLRLDIPEIQGRTIQSSNHRHAAIQKFPPPATVQIVKNILSDQSDHVFPVFRTLKSKDSTDSAGANSGDYAITTAVGIFDISTRTWSIYTKPPATSEPVVVLRF